MGFLSAGKIRKLEELENELRKKSDNLNIQLISTYCEIIDEAIFKDRAGREKKGYVAEHKGDKREIYTQFGNASFSRRYYRNKRDGTYSYLVDEAMGIESYDRVSSRPVGWSREGLKAMVELRVYCYNGGHVETKHIRKSKDSYKVKKEILSKATKVYRMPRES
ncbi:MAG: UPF0236 family protein [Bacillota bacterium]|nr:UPF0236 family protein [Bacillota bacterium]HPZ05598.1 UPF0236 family protein [Clostridiales bacterium]